MKKYNTNHIKQVIDVLQMSLVALKDVGIPRDMAEKIMFLTLSSQMQKKDFAEGYHLNKMLGEMPTPQNKYH